MVKSGWKGKLRVLHPRRAGVVASFALRFPGNPEPQSLHPIARPLPR